MLQSAVAVASECLGEYPEVEEAFPNVNKDAIYNDDEYDTIVRAYHQRRINTDSFTIL